MNEASSSVSALVVPESSDSVPVTAIPDADDRTNDSHSDDADDDDNDNDGRDDDDNTDGRDDDGNVGSSTKRTARNKAEEAREYWKQKRVLRKEKTRAKKQRSAMLGVPFVPKARNKRWLGEDIAVVIARDFVQPTVCIDARFMALMTDKECRGLRTQLSHAYGFMRRIDHPCHLWVANAGTLLNDYMKQLIGVANWPILFKSESVVELFPPATHSIVYLSPDAPDVLDDVHADVVYVVGGIVDHNRLKRATLNEAKQLNLRTARFPIFETLGAKLNNSLNVNHVYEILCHQSQTHNWAESFRLALPKRVLKNSNALPDTVDELLRSKSASTAATTASTASTVSTASTASTTTTTAAEDDKEAQNPRKVSRLDLQ
jgi:tRNA (guanine9-N1)-methyltransferase